MGIPLREMYQQSKSRPHSKKRMLLTLWKARILVRHFPYRHID